MGVPTAIGWDDDTRSRRIRRLSVTTREEPKVCRLSPLEGDGFELSVPGERGYGRISELFRSSPDVSAMNSGYRHIMAAERVKHDAAQFFLGLLANPVRGS
jgi:hypothetical protein